MPEEPGSTPDQLTVNVSDVCPAASASTWLVGDTLSMVFIQSLVWIGAFWSKTIVAVRPTPTWVSEAIPAVGSTV